MTRQRREHRVQVLLGERELELLRAVQLLGETEAACLRRGLLRLGEDLEQRRRYP